MMYELLLKPSSPIVAAFSEMFALVRAYSAFIPAIASLAFVRAVKRM